MKNRIIITTISLATLATITLTAGEALPSPRAKSNQITVATPTANNPNLTATKCTRIGAPRQADIAASCCKVAKASCTPERACCAK